MMEDVIYQASDLASNKRVAFIKDARPVALGCATRTERVW